MSQTIRCILTDKRHQTFYIYCISYQFSLGNPSKDRERFVDAIVLILASDWGEGLSASKLSLTRHSNHVFECRTVLGFAKLNWKHTI